MASVVIDFLFDFASPNCYMCHKVLPEIARRTGAGVRYVPIYLSELFELSGNQPPRERLAAIPNKLRYRDVERERFLCKHRLEAFRPNPHFIVESLDLMCGAVAALEMGRFADYADAMFSGMWEQQLDLSDPEVASRCIEAAGLDADALLREARASQTKEALRESTRLACARGAFGAPTFFVGRDMFFGKDRLDEIESCIRTASA